MIGMRTLGWGGKRNVFAISTKGKAREWCHQIRQGGKRIYDGGEDKNDNDQRTLLYHDHQSIKVTRETNRKKRGEVQRLFPLKKTEPNKSNQSRI